MNWADDIVMGYEVEPCLRRASVQNGVGNGRLFYLYIGAIGKGGKWRESRVGF
jgi:hypothetical protein